VVGVVPCGTDGGVVDGSLQRCDAYGRSFWGLELLGCGVVWTCGAVCIVAGVVAARSAAICDGMGSFVEGSVGRSESDVKNSDFSESDQNLSDGRYRQISEHASRTLRCRHRTSDIGLDLLASQPTHVSVVLLMTCFA
jgi:hypothetical protein